MSSLCGVPQFRCGKRNGSAIIAISFNWVNIFQCLQDRVVDQNTSLLQPHSFVVSVLQAALYREFLLPLQSIDNKGFKICMKELHFKSVYDPVTITWVSMPGNLACPSQIT